MKFRKSCVSLVMWGQKLGMLPELDGLRLFKLLEWMEEREQNPLSDVQKRAFDLELEMPL
jgi:hypothetical protein